MPFDLAVSDPSWPEIVTCIIIAISAVTAATIYVATRSKSMSDASETTSAAISSPGGAFCMNCQSTLQKIVNELATLRERLDGLGKSLDEVKRELYDGVKDRQTAINALEVLTTQHTEQIAELRDTTRCGGGVRGRGKRNHGA